MLGTGLKNLTSFQIKCLGFMISILLSCLWLSYQQPLNIDGITYYHAAQLWANHQYHEALTAYSWPFYPIMLAALSKMFHCSLLTAGHVLTSLLFALITIAFLTLVQTMGGKTKTLLLAAFVILFFPTIAHERAFFYRDFGYYAFSLFAVHYLILFDRHKRAYDALGFTCAMGLAALFRIEGTIFLIFTPLALFFNRQQNYIHRFKTYLKANLFTLLLSGAALIAALFILGSMVQKIRLTAFIQEFFSLPSLISQNFHYFKLIFQESYNAFIAQNASVVIISGFFAIFAASLVATLTPFYCIFLLVYSRYGNFNFDPAVIRNLYAFIFINVITLFIFLFLNFFMIPRYMMFLGLLLLTLVPFALEQFLDNRANWFVKPWQKNLSTGILSAGMCILLLDSVLHFGVNNHYIISAGNWIAKSSPITTRVYSNEPRVLFYTKRNNVNHFEYGKDLNYTNLSSLKLAEYDYFAIKVRQRDVRSAVKLFKLRHLVVLKEFENNRRDKIFILQRDA